MNASVCLVCIHVPLNTVCVCSCAKCVFAFFVGTCTYLFVNVHVRACIVCAYIIIYIYSMCMRNWCACATCARAELCVCVFASMLLLCFYAILVLMCMSSCPHVRISACMVCKYIYYIYLYSMCTRNWCACATCVRAELCV